MAAADLGPVEGLGIFIPVLQPAHDGALKPPILSKLSRRMACPIISANQRSTSFEPRSAGGSGDESADMQLATTQQPDAYGSRSCHR